MFDARIIDPTKVTRTGMADAASGTGWLATSKANCRFACQDDGGAAGIPGGGMGGGLHRGVRVGVGRNYLPGTKQVFQQESWIV